MKIQSQYARTIAHRCRGSVLLFGLVLMGMATFGLVSWISLLTTRSYMIETAEYAVQRRVAYHNATAVAEEHLYQNAITGTNVPAINVELANYMGAVDIEAHAGAALAETNFVGSVNRFGPSDGLSYSLPVTTAISDGAETTTRMFLMNSRNPMLSGDLLTLNAPSIITNDRRLSGDFWVEGRSTIWLPDALQTYTYGDFRSEQYTTPTEGATGFNVMDFSGANLLPANFPFIPMTAGMTSAGNLGFDGTARSVNYSSNSVNSIYDEVMTYSPVVVTGTTSSSQPGVTSNGSGRITLDLSDENLSLVVIESNVNRIVFDGQSNQSDFDSAAALDPVVVVYRNSPGSAYDIGRIEFNNANGRQLLLAINAESGASDNYVNLRFDHADDNPIWRLFVVSENFRTNFAATTGGTLTLVGGIRGDRRISETTTSFDIRVRKEPSPKNLIELLADRNAWLESFSDGAYTAGTDPFASYNRPAGSVALNNPTENEPPGGSSGSTPGGGGPGGDPDTDPPTVTLAPSNDPVAGPFTVIVSFSESVTGVDSSDFLLSNGVLSSLTGSGQNYIFSVTPISLGPVTVGLPAGRASDAAGNGNVAASTITVNNNGPTTIDESNFDFGLDDWTFVENAFYSTNGPSSQANYEFQTVGQFDGGGIRIEIGGEDNDDYSLSAALSKTIFIDTESTGTLSFDYRIFMPEQYETGEDGELIVAVDGNIVGVGANNYVDKIVNCCGNGGGDQEIISSATVNLGTLTAGVHTIEIGIYNNLKTFFDEFMELDIDNIKLEASLP
ncbi:MAG: Ig-like domain-containing protein [Verrucomicrobiota bacterium]